MRTRRALACLLVAAALAACATQADLGGDDRTAAERRADEATAGKMLLTLDDLPAGYRAGPVDQGDDAGSSRVDAEVARCLHVSPDRLDSDNPKATSPTFSTVDDSTEITAEVTFTPSTRSAASRMDLYQSDAAPRCYEQAFRQELTKQATRPGVDLGEPSLDRLDVPDIGDETVAFRVSVRISGGGVDIPLYFDVLLVRVGRIGITTTFATQGEPFDRHEAADLTRIVADRAPEA
jgi:hypothetical protein